MVTFVFAQSAGVMPYSVGGHAGRDPPLYVCMYVCMYIREYTYLTVYITRK